MRKPRDLTREEIGELMDIFVADKSYKILRMKPEGSALRFGIKHTRKGVNRTDNVLIAPDRYDGSFFSDVGPCLLNERYVSAQHVMDKFYLAKEISRIN